MRVFFVCRLQKFEDSAGLVSVHMGQAFFRTPFIVPSPCGVGSVILEEGCQSMPAGHGGVPPNGHHTDVAIRVGPILDAAI